jgi:hypothetical protein
LSQPRTRAFRGGATAKEGREHHAKDFPQQPLLASQAAFELLDEIVRQADVVQGLFEGLDGTLRLGMVALEAFRSSAATALSGFGLFFGVSFASGHGALLGSGWFFSGCRLPKRKPHPSSRL